MCGVAAWARQRTGQLPLSGTQNHFPRGGGPSCPGFPSHHEQGRRAWPAGAEPSQYWWGPARGPGGYEQRETGKLHAGQEARPQQDGRQAGVEAEIWKKKEALLRTGCPFKRCTVMCLLGVRVDQPCDSNPERTWTPTG